MIIESKINRFSYPDYIQKYNLGYYNYLKDDRFSAEDFFDSDHLNTRGAEKFSRLLRDEIIENMSLCNNFVSEINKKWLLINLF